MTSLNDHVYECPSDPNDGLVLVTTGRVGEFGQFYPGIIWCWSHGAWESVPDVWYDREEALRAAITEEWKRIRAKAPYVTFSGALTAAINEYCEHGGRRKPDMGDRYDVFRFLSWLENEKPVRSLEDHGKGRK